MLETPLPIRDGTMTHGAARGTQRRENSPVFEMLPGLFPVFVVVGLRRVDFQIVAGLRLLCGLDRDVVVVLLAVVHIVPVVWRSWPLTPAHAPRKRFAQSMSRTSHAFNEPGGVNGEAAVVL